MVAIIGTIKPAVYDPGGPDHIYIHKCTYICASCMYHMIPSTQEVVNARQFDMIASNG